MPNAVWGMLLSCVQAAKALLKVKARHTAPAHAAKLGSAPWPARAGRPGADAGGSREDLISQCS
jgi:hypothetical protein